MAASKWGAGLFIPGGLCLACECGLQNLDIGWKETTMVILMTQSQAVLYLIFQLFSFPLLASSPLHPPPPPPFLSKDRPYQEKPLEGWERRITVWKDQEFKQIDILLATQHIRYTAAQLEPPWAGRSNWRKAEQIRAFLALRNMMSAFTSMFQQEPSLLPREIILYLLCFKQGGSFEERIAIIFYRQTH